MGGQDGGGSFASGGIGHPWNFAVEVNVGDVGELLREEGGNE